MAVAECLGSNSNAQATCNDASYTVLDGSFPLPHNLITTFTAKMASLAKSTTVNQADSHTYTIDFDPAWTIGTGTYIQTHLTSA
jgi:hypothetical protein